MMKKMAPLTLKKSPQVYEVASPMSPSKVLHKLLVYLLALLIASTPYSTQASVYKGYAHGCDIKAIITSMKNDQREHQYASMPEPYAKVNHLDRIKLDRFG
jgi:hypothetical protein